MITPPAELTPPQRGHISAAIGLLQAGSKVRDSHPAITRGATQVPSPSSVMTVSVVTK